MGTLKPEKIKRAEILHIRTLKGLTEQERCNFSYADLPRYFRVMLWDRDHICKWENCKYPDRIILTFEESTLDHIVPRSKGGRTRLLNLQLMHARCNSEKSNKMPAHYNKYAFVPIPSRSYQPNKYLRNRGIA